MSSHDRIVRPGAGVSHGFMPGERFTWKATGEVTGGALDIAELALEAAVGPPEHIHHQNDEAYYILNGRYRFKVGEEIAEATNGTFVFIPRGTPHAWVNLDQRPGRVLVLFTPGTMAGYFHELQPLLPALMAGMPDMTNVDPAVLAEAEVIMRRYDYELVGPPLR